MSTNVLSRRRELTSATRRRPAAHGPEQKLPDLQSWVEKTKALPDLRWERIQALREALAAGEYDVDSRLNGLLDRLPDELFALAPARE